MVPTSLVKAGASRSFSRLPATNPEAKRRAWSRANPLSRSLLAMCIALIGGPETKLGGS